MGKNKSVVGFTIFAQAYHLYIYECVSVEFFFLEDDLFVPRDLFYLFFYRIFFCVTTNKFHS